MKKFLFGVFTLVVMCSCNITPTPRYETVEVDLPLETFINDFITDRPNLFNNDITIEEGSKEFVNELTDTLETVNGKMFMFDGIPMRLETINKTKMGYVAQFGTWLVKSDRFKFHYVSDINYDVFCVIPDSIVSELKEDEYYILDCTYVGNLTYDKCVSILGNRPTVWNTAVELVKDSSFSTDYYSRKVNLGCMLVLFEDIKPYVSRETKTIKIETEKSI